jgi:hypothetical protein
VSEPTTVRFPCPWLRADVELTSERERQIGERHPELLPGHRARLAEVIARPDTLRRSVRSATARLFSRWYSDIRHGRHIVVVVQHDGSAGRYWIIAAYMARRLAAGEIEWPQS